MTATKHGDGFDGNSVHNEGDKKMSEPKDMPAGLTSEQEAELKARYTDKKGVIDYKKLKEVADGITAAAHAARDGVVSASPEDTKTLRDRTTYEERATARARLLEGEDRTQHLGHLAVAQAAGFAQREKDKENAQGNGGVGGPG